MNRLFLLLPLLYACNSDTSVIKVQRKLNVAPELLDLGNIAVGETATADISLTHVDGEAIQVVNAAILDVAGSWFSVDTTALPTVEPGATETLTVTYAPGDAGYHLARLTIFTDEEKDSEHVVDLRGSAALPLADLEPPSIDFGPVAAGQTADRSVTLTNTGLVNLSLAGVSFSDSRFTTTQSATVLGPGESLDIPLRYAAADENPATSTATLDLGAAPARTVDLRANDCEHGDIALYDTDADGVATCGGDCDDHDAASLPGGIEVCDGADNDCNGTADDTTDCYDDDKDGRTELDGDCNDSNASVNPDMQEDYLNGIDDDCDGVVDYGDQDLDGDGYGLLAGDCDDTDAGVYPGATERADGVDNDCDRVIDDNTNAYDDDGDGFTENGGDCNDGDTSIYPSAKEREDGLDNDCNGLVDDGTAAYDDDADGFSENGGDCDDARADVNPAVLEVAGDGLDNDCDGLVK